MVAPGLLPAYGGESFPGIANSPVSLGEPFRLREPEETVSNRMKRRTRCASLKSVGEFYRVRKDGEARVAMFKACQNAGGKASYRRRHR